MQAEDLAEQIPLVRRGTSAMEAARVVASLRVGSVVVADDDDEPMAVVAGLDVLRLVVPPYVRENPALPHVYDEAGSDELCAGLREHTVADLLEDRSLKTSPVPQVLPEDTLVEIATVMLRERVSVVVVRAPGRPTLGVVTLARVLAAVLNAAGEAGPAERATLARDLADLHAEAANRPDAAG